MKHGERVRKRESKLKRKPDDCLKSSHASPARLRFRRPSSIDDRVTLELCSCVHANNVFIAEVDKLSTVYEKASQFKRPSAFTAQVWLPRSRMVSGHQVP